MKISPAMNQPKDTLQMIFHELFPPPSLPIRPPLFRKRYAIRPFSGRILSVITLCRSWYLAGLPTLFRDIQIVDLKQLSSLLHILKVQDTPFRFWVRSIEFHAPFPQDRDTFDIIFTKPFGQLSQMCPNLKTLAFTGEIGTLPVPTQIYSSMSPFQLRLPFVTQPASLTHLLIGRVESLHGFLTALGNVSGTLVSLTILATNFDNVEPVLTCPSTVAPLALSRLRILTVAPTREVLKVIQSWELPQLERLTLLRTSAFKTGYTTCKEYFGKFGKGIKALELYPGMIFRQEFGSLPWLWYSDLLKWVPALEHLVVHHDRKWYSRNTAYSHANVKWIDVWEEGPETILLGSPLLDYNRMGYFIAHPAGEPASSATQSTIVQFPSLRGVRVFPNRLRSWGNLPFDLPLSPTKGPEEVKFQPSGDFNPEVEHGNASGRDSDQNQADDEDSDDYVDYNDDYNADEWYDNEGDDDSDDDDDT